MEVDRTRGVVAGGEVTVVQATLEQQEADQGGQQQLEHYDNRHVDSIVTPIPRLEGYLEKISPRVVDR